jgi:hypothetical protein
VSENGFFQFLYINVRIICHQLIADAGSSNTTRLPIIMPNACPEFALWMEEGGMEECQKERNLCFSALSCNVWWCHDSAVAEVSTLNLKTGGSNQALPTGERKWREKVTIL